MAPITIAFYQIQFRKTVRDAWQDAGIFDFAFLAPALDALPETCRKLGTGFYQILRVNSDGKTYLAVDVKFGEDAQ